MSKLIQIFGEPISTHTSEQATEDGILFDIKEINPKFEKGVISHVTTNLMEQHRYIENGTINIPNMIDLLNQTIRIIQKKSNDFKEFDAFFSGKIELPSGGKLEIWIELNELGKYTILLPEDH